MGKGFVKSHFFKLHDWEAELTGRLSHWMLPFLITQSARKQSNLFIITIKNIANLVNTFYGCFKLPFRIGKLTNLLCTSGTLSKG